MSRASTRSAGPTKSDQRALASLTEIASQLGPSDLYRADKAAVLIQTLRDRPTWLQTGEGKMINKKCLEQIRDTEWERVLFPERGTPEAERAVREFRKRMREAYPGDADGETQGEGA